MNCAIFHRTTRPAARRAVWRLLLTALLLGMALNAQGKTCGTARFNGQTKTIPCADGQDKSEKTCGYIKVGNKTKQIPCAAPTKASGDSAPKSGAALAQNAAQPTGAGKGLTAAKEVKPSFDCHATVRYQGRVFHLSSKYCNNTPATVRARDLGMPGQSFLARQQALRSIINQIADQYQLDRALVHALIATESAYRDRALSHAGAQGLMQLMPATARHYGVSDSYNIEQNLHGGMKYLSYLLTEFKQNKELALAAYNAGETNVRKYGNRIPPFVETRAYVPKVLSYYQKYQTEWKDHIQ